MHDFDKYIIDNYIEKYSVKLLKTLIGKAFVCEENINDRDFSKELKKHNILSKKSKSKAIAVYHKTYNGKFSLYIKNGKNQNLVYLKIKRVEIPKILKYLNEVEKNTQGG